MLTRVRNAPTNQTRDSEPTPGEMEQC